MRELTFDVTTDKILCIGYKGEDNASKITFEGFEPENETSKVFMKMEGIKDRISLVDMELVVTNELTKIEGEFEAVLYEQSADEAFTRLSPTFKLIVEHALEVI